MENSRAKIPTPEKIAAAIETIDHLTAWLQETGLSASAIAQFKFNSLASMYPELRGIAETAKQLIGVTSPLTEFGMTVTELAAVLADSLKFKIKPDVVNKALVVLIKDAKSFKDCQKWIDRQLAQLAIEKAFGNQ
ncbi:hypothetical protein QUB47_35135 [Microcoleus sp. AT9_B5]